MTQGTNELGTFSKLGGGVVVKALCYKTDFRPDGVNEFFSIYLILPASLGPGLYSACNTNEY
jgi:hypothetical protein